MIKKTILASLVFSGASLYAQSYNTLKSQLDFCKTESEKIESDLLRYKELLEIQGKEITSLKYEIQDKESTIKNLESENKELKNAALSLYSLGEDFESQGKLKEALQVYKLLIRSYPASLQAVSSKMNIKNIAQKNPEK